MSFMLKFSKWVLISLITEWFEGRDIVLLNASLGNETDNILFIALMKEYFHNYYKSRVEVSLLEACGYYKAYSVCIPVNCIVYICKLDLLRIIEYNWSDTVAELVSSIRHTVVVTSLKPDENKFVEMSTLLASLKHIESLNANHPNDVVLDIFSHTRSSSLTCINLTIDVWYIAQDVAYLCQMSPALTSLTCNGRESDCILLACAVHCKHLTYLDCPFEKDRAATVLILHGRFRLREWQHGSAFNRDNNVVRHLLMLRGNDLAKLQITKYILEQVYELMPLYPHIVWSLECSCDESDDHKIDLIRCVGADQLSGIAFRGYNLRRYYSIPHMVSLINFSSQCLLSLTIQKVIIPDELLFAVFKCPLLDSLSIGHCQNSRKDLLSLILHHCTVLSVLEIYENYCGFSSQLCVNNSKLTKVSFAWCGAIEHSTCSTLCSIPTLTSLSIRGGKLINFEHADHKWKSNLSVLNLPNVSLSDESLLWFVSRCPLLVVLSINSNASLTVSGFNSIGPFCKLIRKLDISYCLKFKESIVEVFCRYFKKLTHLYMYGHSWNDPKLATEVNLHCVALLFFDFR